jgi:hypothetical protein
MEMQVVQLAQYNKVVPVVVVQEASEVMAHR